MPCRPPGRGVVLSLSNLRTLAPTRPWPTTSRTIWKSDPSIPRRFDLSLYRCKSSASNRVSHSGIPSRPIHANQSHSKEWDTIFALASGRGRAGIAVIRISGPDADKVYLNICKLPGRQAFSKALPEARRLVLRDLVDPFSGQLLDKAAVIWFEAGESYTGEKTLELHIHGGIATVRDVLDSLSSLSISSNRLRIRPSEPGEFTRRAFTNAKLDLCSSEALHSLISSETTSQRILALRSTGGGGQSKRFKAMRDQILKSQALVEAMIDFGEEEGVEDEVLESAFMNVLVLRQMIVKELGLVEEGAETSSLTRVDGQRGEMTRTGVYRRSVGEIVTDGVRLAIYGPPNAGKSTLLNRLADREAAIVSSIPGTTRDVLEVQLEIEGFKVLVYDTAGLREDHDLHDQGAKSKEEGSRIGEIERIGMNKTREAVKSADLSLLVYPADKLLSEEEGSIRTSRELLWPLSYKLDDISPEEGAGSGGDEATAGDEDRHLIFINKLDLLQSDGGCDRPQGRIKVWKGSLRSGTGYEELVRGISSVLVAKYRSVLDSDRDVPLVTNARHRHHLFETLRCLDEFLAAAKGGLDLVLASESLRRASRSIGRITGSDVTSDEVLGEIFSKFCIGK
ncbi:P-loop containing nucleoside triphosphate hydrolase protein [Violaceomyces palustris]|uniref:P-loop containing nucleoside triphosphate hydrolase protein n=1 Tax=Violaceomyces palustris TaxID=1673888 RepID=A0ACD0NWE4_9BASI|nr:P-loop containing nucleoside triphosphate hydrolase protein [Violaceomyces palustris]